MTLKHAAADSYTVVGLQEFVDYELFVQPFNEAGIVGLPTALKLVKTHQTRPSNSPVILEAKMLNATMLMVSWNPLHEDDHNGPLLGFKVSYWAIPPFFTTSSFQVLRGRPFSDLENNL